MINVLISDPTLLTNDLPSVGEIFVDLKSFAIEASKDPRSIVLDLIMSIGRKDFKE